MILVTGEILFDIFPNRKVLGGAPFNFAFHLKKLGLPVRFISRVGKDDAGRRILSFLDRHGFDRRDIQVDPHHATGSVQVDILDGDHRFFITPDVAWDHIDLTPRLSRYLAAGPSLFYFGTLFQRTANGRTFIDHMTKEIQGRTPFFCDLNLRPDADSQDSIQASLKTCDILKLNAHELEAVTGCLPEDRHRLEDQARHLMDSYGVQQVLLTLGAEGSLWVSAEKHYHAPAVSPYRFADAVGAGDAFAAIYAASYLKGVPVPAAMHLAARFSGYICSIKGALPEDESVYQALKRDLLSFQS